MTDQIRAISFGGGQQSTALLVLAAQGRIDFRTFLFANVGDDTEDPRTLEYIKKYAQPFAEKHGLDLIELRRIMKRTGEERTLYDQVIRPSRTIDIPMRMDNGAPGNRNCTKEYKLNVIGRQLVRMGATQDNPAIVGVGISLDEVHRATNRRNSPIEQTVYPLLHLGLRRTDCQRIIRDAGLPVPPKSACWFCPMKRPEDWQNLRRERPDLFARACHLEATIIERRRTLLDRNGQPKDAVYLTRFGKPLAEAIPDGVDLLPMFDEADGACDNSSCFT
ncbi:phosphoadenosine phosphosulfate reductase (plasmid) [Streptomyces chartreusis]|uniref:phosphoadenosine phosphosulfate reductase n=1 Tax=Streptomyces chartreusis TaxID=1969 RepID=UPI0037DD4297|nr:phosphoadenosine phosphosulfate reductase [Streptomyces chartreusis]